jgi:hypothetical protein
MVSEELVCSPVTGTLLANQVPVTKKILLEREEISRNAIMDIEVLPTEEGKPFVAIP